MLLLMPEGWIAENHSPCPCILNITILKKKMRKNIMTKKVEREDVGGWRQESVFRKNPNRKGLNDVSSVHSPYNPGILGCGAGLSVLLQGRLPWSLGLQGRLQVLHKESILFKNVLSYLHLPTTFHGVCFLGSSPRKLNRYLACSQICFSSLFPI